MGQLFWSPEGRGGEGSIHVPGKPPHAGAVAELHPLPEGWGDLR